jgi:hypothetical protein
MRPLLARAAHLDKDIFGQLLAVSAARDGQLLTVGAVRDRPEVVHLPAASKARVLPKLSVAGLFCEE